MDTHRTRILDLEERFWLDDAAFYEQNLTPEAVMVFPDPVGVMSREAAVASIREAARWRSVDMTDVITRELSPNVILLSYRATAARDPDASYSARVCSIYVDRDTGWKLAFHQQAPL